MDGGSPVKSKETRRNNVSRLASGDGAKLSRSSFCSTNASIGFRTQAELLTIGRGGRFGGINDQCFCHLAPCATHSRSVSISVLVSFRPEYAGGIRCALFSTV